MRISPYSHREPTPRLQDFDLFEYAASQGRTFARIDSGKIKSIISDATLECVRIDGTERRPQVRRHMAYANLAVRHLMSGLGGDTFPLGSTSDHFMVLAAPRELQIVANTLGVLAALLSSPTLGGADASTASQYPESSTTLTRSPLFVDAIDDMLLERTVIHIPLNNETISSKPDAHAFMTRPDGTPLLAISEETSRDDMPDTPIIHYWVENEMTMGEVIYPAAPSDRLVNDVRRRSYLDFNPTEYVTFHPWLKPNI